MSSFSSPLSHRRRINRVDCSVVSQLCVVCVRVSPQPKVGDGRREEGGEEGGLRAYHSKSTPTQLERYCYCLYYHDLYCMYEV